MKAMSDSSNTESSTTSGENSRIQSPIKKPDLTFRTVASSTDAEYFLLPNKELARCDSDLKKNKNFWKCTSSEDSIENVLDFRDIKSYKNDNKSENSKKGNSVYTSPKKSKKATKSENSNKFKDASKCTSLVKSQEHIIPQENKSLEKNINVGEENDWRDLSPECCKPKKLPPLYDILKNVRN